MNILDDAQRCLTSAIHPLLQSEPAGYRFRKIIHDPIWGTTRLEAWEAAILDIPYFQRLRGLKQTGFAHFTYPSAEHSRFQHTLGVVHAAGRIFDSLRERVDERGITARTSPEMKKKLREILCDNRQRVLLRLAALVHDLGHSFYSHTSERVFSLLDPFPKLIQSLTTSAANAPGAAEVLVYLLVTSEEWRTSVTEAWEATGTKIEAPTQDEWKLMGRWVMGQEERPEAKFLTDIISGPLDADKLDYIARDAYSAGLPITYDLERFVSTVAVDEQNGRSRLSIPAQGINALEQLVMSRLVLTSYLYHHQKVRAAEVHFERALIREVLDSGTVLGTQPPWPLFSMEDADVYAFARSEAEGRISELMRRQLPVRLAEFRRWTIEHPESETATSAYTELVSPQMTRDLTSYKRLLAIENEVAEAAGLEAGQIIIDVPRPPAYKDLEDLEIPNDITGGSETSLEVLDYHRWIDAYQAHRAYVRIFCPRSVARNEQVWIGVRDWFQSQDLGLRENARRYTPLNPGSANGTE